MSALLKNTFVARLNGDKPSPFKAVLTSAVAGVAAAAVTYRVLRS